MNWAQSHRNLPCAGCAVCKPCGIGSPEAWTRGFKGPTARSQSRDGCAKAMTLQRTPCPDQAIASGKCKHQRYCCCCSNARRVDHIRCAELHSPSMRRNHWPQDSTVNEARVLSGEKQAGWVPHHMVTGRWPDGDGPHREGVTDVMGWLCGRLDQNEPPMGSIW